MNLANNFFHGPEPELNRKSTAYVLAYAENRKADKYQVILKTPEAYYFTVLASIEAIKKIIDKPLSGALTPSQAFGYNFPLEIDNVKRSDVFALSDMI